MTDKKYVDLGIAEGKRRREATLAVESLLKRWIKEKGEQVRCPICGEDNPKTFQKHHMDGNHNNNNKGNIVPICSNCHTLTYRAKYQLKELWEKRHEKWSNLREGARKPHSTVLGQQ
jgi:predicted HNH restriction endonuclease